MPKVMTSAFGPGIQRQEVIHTFSRQFIKSSDAYTPLVRATFIILIFDFKKS
jgi:hypothetical protein